MSTTKRPEGASASQYEAVNPTQLFEFSKEQTEAMLGVQQEVLHSWENARRLWLNHVKSDADLWSRMMTKMSSVKSPPEAIQIYQEWMAQELQSVAEDGRQMTQEFQKIMQKTTQSH